MDIPRTNGFLFPLLLSFISWRRKTGSPLHGAASLARLRLLHSPGTWVTDRMGPFLLDLPVELLDSIRSYLSLVETARLSATCRALRSSAWSATRWNIDRFLEKSGWVADGARFREELGRADAYVLGYVPFSFLAGVASPYMMELIVPPDAGWGASSDLTSVFNTLDRWSGLESLRKYLVESEGFERVERYVYSYGGGTAIFRSKSNQLVKIHCVSDVDPVHMLRKLSGLSAGLCMFGRDSLITLFPSLTFGQRRFMPVQGLVGPWKDEWLCEAGLSLVMEYNEGGDRKHRIRACRFFAAFTSGGFLDPISKHEIDGYNEDDVLLLQPAVTGLGVCAELSPLET
jgi:hypothetical protein